MENDEIKNEDNKINGKKIKETIRNQGLKMWWVAEEIGIHKTTLRRWVNGKIRQITPANLERLALALSTTTHSFLR